MKIDDVNAFKGAVKDAVVSWGNKKIEELFKGKPIEQFAKKGLRNIIAREDEKINGYVDNAFLFLADETGAVDSDTVIDDLCAMFVNMKETTYPVGPVDLKRIIKEWSKQLRARKLDNLDEIDKSFKKFFC